MNKKLMIVFSLIVLISGFLFAQELEIYTEISGQAQFYDEGGYLTGSSVEIVREIQNRIGDNTEIHVVPWARGYNVLENKENVMLFSTTLTEERKPKFKWVGPVYRLDWAFFVKKGSQVNITSLEEAKELGAIGTYRDDAREQFLIQEGFTNLDIASNSVINVKKLMAGRIDAVMASDSGLKVSLKNAGYNFEMVEKILDIKTYELFIAFSKETPDSVVEKWNKALKEMYQDGTFEKLYKKWYPDSELPEYKVVE